MNIENMGEYSIIHNDDGTIQKEVDGVISDKYSVIDDFDSKYIYSQLTSEIKGKLTEAGLSDNIYCSATALATALGMYYGDDTKPMDYMNNFITGTTKGSGFTWDSNKAYWSSTNMSESECMEIIKNSISNGVPIIIQVNTYHYVTVVGYDADKDIKDIEFRDLVIIDPGVEPGKDTAFALIRDLNKYNSIINDGKNHLQVMPLYIIDGTGNFVLDDDGNRITDYRQIFGDDFVPQGFIADVDAFKEAGAIINGEPKEEENTVYGGKGSFEAIYSAIAKTVNKLFMTSVGGVLNGKNENDYLGGSAGNDNLYGYGGDDIIIGRKGNDYLAGGHGNDTYVFNLGDGQDTIYDCDNDEKCTNTIAFGNGIKPEDVRMTRHGADLWIEILGTDDMIKVQAMYNATNTKRYQIQNITFTDGTVWDSHYIYEAVRQFYGTDKNEYIYGFDTLSNPNEIFYGGAGNDNIYAYSGDDVIYGGKGNDFLSGGDGNDTYIFNLGDGKDTIYDLDNSTDCINTIAFGEGITPENVLMLRKGGNLLIQILGTEDSITVQGMYNGSSDYERYQIQRIQFFDETVWDKNYIYEHVNQYFGSDKGGYLYGNDTKSNPNEIFYGGVGNDSIYGYGGDDKIFGGKGNDFLAGGDGNDTYYFSPGDGKDSICDFDNDIGCTNTIYFMEGINPKDVRMTRQSNNLLIQILGTEDSITVQGMYNGSSDYEKYQIQQIQFADGTIWNQNYIFEHVNQYFGSDKGGYLYGNDTKSNPNEIFYGGAGNDRIYGYSGNDTIIGGKGNDYLAGGDGNDTYYFSPGDGKDSICDFDNNIGCTNTIYFMEGINPKDVRMTRQGNNLLIQILGTEDSITVQGMYNGSSDYEKYQIQQIQFADGTIWGENYIYKHVNQYFASDSGNYLYGNDTKSNPNEIFYGGAGNDRIYGYSGNDTIIGGKGNDYLAGGDGNDTYIFNSGDGNDTIYDCGGSDSLIFNVGGKGLSFKQNGNDLLVYVSGTDDSVNISGWFTDDKFKIEHITTSDGYSTTYDRVNLMIQAMAAYEHDTGMSWNDAVTNNKDSVNSIISEMWIKEAV